MGTERNYYNESAIGKAEKQFQGEAQRQAAVGAADTDKLNAQNRPDYANPFGGSTWETDPTTGQVTMKQQLYGGLGGNNQELQQQYADALRGPIDGNAARDEAMGAAYNQSASRLDPEWNQREEAMRTQLLNQGLDPSSQASRNDMGNFGRARNDAYGAAMGNAMNQGRQAGDMAFQNNMAGQMGALQNMQQLANLLRLPNFNEAIRQIAPDYLTSLEEFGNEENNQSAHDRKQTSDLIGAGGQGVSAALAVV